MDELLVEFKSESKELVEELKQYLDEAEEGEENRLKLDKFGQVVDRIMGSAQSLTMAVEDTSHLKQIGAYAEICKIVGYRGSQIIGNETFYDIVVAMLQDATEMLEQLIEELGTEREKALKDLLTQTFLERLKWVNSKFAADMRSTVSTSDVVKEGEGNPEQKAIDDLLASLGV